MRQAGVEAGLKKFKRREPPGLEWRRRWAMAPGGHVRGGGEILKNLGGSRMEGPQGLGVAGATGGAAVAGEG